MKSQADVLMLEEQIWELVESSRFDEAKAVLYQAAKAGSGNSCFTLWTALHPQAQLFPDEFQAVFKKSRRRSNRYSNRELKCLRHFVRLGDYRAMFGLYNAYCSGNPRLRGRSRLEKAEYWLRRASESGDEFMINELNLFINRHGSG